MNDKKMLVVVVLDRSGSMQSVKDDTIGGFNSFLKQNQQIKDTETLITLVQFDDRYEINYEHLPIKDAKELTPETYCPRGSTALLGAIGTTINSTGEYLRNLPENERPSKVLFCIITDGAENASDSVEWGKSFNKTKINEMITHQKEKYSWEFVFLGANQDAIKEAAGYGINAKTSMTYAHNAIGTQSAFRSVGNLVSSYACSGYACFTDEDRKLQNDLLKAKGDVNVNVLVNK